MVTPYNGNERVIPRQILSCKTCYVHRKIGYDPSPRAPFLPDDIVIFEDNLEIDDAIVLYTETH